MKDRPEDLIDRMISGRVTLAAWRRMLPLRDIDKPTKADIADIGYAGLFFNRTCFLRHRRRRPDRRHRARIRVTRSTVASTKGG